MAAATDLGDHRGLTALAGAFSGRLSTRSLRAKSGIPFREQTDREDHRGYNADQNIQEGSPGKDERGGRSAADT